MVFHLLFFRVKITNSIRCLIFLKLDYADHCSRKVQILGPIKKIKSNWSNMATQNYAKFNILAEIKLLVEIKKLKMD